MSDDTLKYSDIKEIVKRYHNEYGLLHVYGKTANDRFNEVYGVIPNPSVPLEDRQIVRVLAAPDPDLYEAIP